VIPPPELGELEAFRSLLGGPGGEVAEIGGAVCTAFRETPASALLNRALGVGIAEPATKGLLDEIDAFFAERGVAYSIPVTPDSHPAELASWLEGRGFQHGYAWTKFQRRAKDAGDLDHKSGLRVEQVGADRGTIFADVFSRAYGTPAAMRGLLERLPGVEGWHCFVAFADETPAATGAIFVSGTVGWLGVAGTLPEFRRRGAQNALLSARIRAGAAAGCETLVTETGELVEGRPAGSYRNIVRAGFEPLYVRQNYLSSSGADTSGTRA
jgi:hypothetical protein